MYAWFCIVWNLSASQHLMLVYPPRIGSFSWSWQWNSCGETTTL